MKIGIVGSGFVGSTAAYAMVMAGIGREIVLVDIDKKRSEAEANDIVHAVPFANPLKIRSGEYTDLKGSRLVIISAGVSQKPSERRIDLLRRNAAVFKEVVPAVVEKAPEAIFIVATNPLDMMTYLAARHASVFGIPESRVLGTGTMLDTARFRSLLGEHMGVDPQHVHAYVIGEHGDSEVLTWSTVTIAGMHLEEFCRSRQINLDESVRESIDDRVRNAAYAIIEGKGATYYGIGSALAKIVDVILHDQRSILTVSTRDPKAAGIPNVSISLPRIVGGEGILDTLPLPLSDEENMALQKSAGMVRKAIDELDLHHG
ncbi:MAG: L-lactate dehydrogenase [Deltaproteobacteria bacterium]|nr:L-lactate dehydrogenase [Deltaproteobacteria bacterium]